MNSTEATPAPAVGGRQVGQVLAGHYRLAVFKGGDDVADVWHALDDSTEKVVTLEILRDRDNEAARQRFLAEARRMQAIERPSVMRVASIHDGATDTFIVFEHLIPLPVVLTELSSIAKDVKPATKAADEKTVVLAAMAGPTRPPVAPDPAVAPEAAAFDATEAPDEAEPTIVELAPPEMPAAASATTVGLPGSLHAVSGALTTAKSDVSAAVAEVRALLPQRIDTSFVRSLLARVSTSVRPLASRVSTRVASSAAPLIGRAASSAAPLIRRAASSAGPLMARAGSNAGPLITRAASNTGPLLVRVSRLNPVVLAVPIGLLLLAVFVASPLDDAIVDVLRPAPAPSPTATPRAALAPAPFQVPPLSAYGAAFESQGAYPTTSPNGTVEWVVALRNTGSAGWYRGIEGAQAALALPDGTGVAVQSTDYVAPGQVGWFVVHFRASAELGTYRVPLLPRIDGRGPLPELGIYAVVTVAKNP